MDGFLLSKLVAAWLLPPAVMLLGVAAGLALRTVRRRAGNLVVAASLLTLFLATLDPVAHLLLRGLDHYPALGPDRLEAHRPGAVVVLSGGRTRHAREYGGETVDAHTLERLRYGVRVYRATGLPLLFSGGNVTEDDGLSTAFLMKEAAVDDFRVPVVWLEEESRNTWENALYTARLLDQEGVRRVVLVTHGYHMPRAMACFEAVGLSPLAAPVGVMSSYEPALFDWIPSSAALRASWRALHEYVGLAWYELRYF